MIRFKNMRTVYASIIVNWNRGQKLAIAQTCLTAIWFFIRSFYSWHKSRFVYTLREHILDCFGLAFTKIQQDYEKRNK